MSISQLLKEFILGAQSLGLSTQDLDNAQDLLDHYEFGLCFDTITTQLHEYEIEIDEDFYSLVLEIAKLLKLDCNDYTYMKELIRSPSHIPKPLKDNLMKIIDSLK